MKPQAVQQLVLATINPPSRKLKKCAIKLKGVGATVKEEEGEDDEAEDEEDEEEEEEEEEPKPQRKKRKKGN